MSSVYLHRDVGEKNALLKFELHELTVNWLLCFAKVVHTGPQLPTRSSMLVFESDEFFREFQEMVQSY
jgi:hypothetical protein